MILIKTISLIATLGLIYLTYRFAGHPSAPKFLNELGVFFGLIGMPLMILLLACLTQARWQPFFFICALIPIMAFSAMAGYLLTQRLTDNDPFVWGIGTSFIVTLLAGGPLAAYLIP